MENASEEIVPLDHGLTVSVDFVHSAVLTVDLGMTLHPVGAECKYEVRSWSGVNPGECSSDSSSSSSCPRCVVQPGVGREAFSSQSSCG